MTTTYAHARHQLPLAFPCRRSSCRMGIGLPCTCGSSSFHAPRRDLVTKTGRPHGGGWTAEQVDEVIPLVLEVKRCRRHAPELLDAALAAVTAATDRIRTTNNEPVDEPVKQPVNV